LIRTEQSEQSDLLRAGRPPGGGSFVCVDCSLPLTLEADEAMPQCPSCGSTRFRRASLFEQPTLRTPPVEAEKGTPDWLAEKRDEIESPGQYFAVEIDDEPKVIPLEDGWSRIGRTHAAEVRLDDPTVSRRHAVVVAGEGGLRILDDRSLNGVCVNGERCEWSRLSDGDEVQVGRYRLFVIDTA
jgi:DNA-directed RNA polymerase subunit RPC12/RpoP